MPFLFQRQLGTVRRVISPATILVMLQWRCAELAEQHPEFRTAGFTPHDFRRLLATELVNNGLPIHIGAALLGHLNIQTTRGYVAIFNEDLVRHYQAYLDRRRQARAGWEKSRASTSPSHSSAKSVTRRNASPAPPPSTSDCLPSGRPLRRVQHHEPSRVDLRGAEKLPGPQTRARRVRSALRHTL